eukprot:CAMPEP_0204898104 /NCGR_PEP_ID=MMETSP1397-20131031/1097_1 /ASSEMBLY_ACC=CAM_ASM_000891 /TAXON_ID=49980 /ORGANISM="Climacostomum Climacostomum virens, Strain Stock W-24" /LENGTH=342 /DNA_ID=CAMNT_0052065907 /DNA_START=589 /DNA_END=1617 /DNA_ORIENTATION=+
MQAYYDRKTDRLRKRLAEQKEEVPHSPRVNPRSASLASKKLGSGKVQDRLHEDSMRRTQLRNEVAMKELEISKAQSKPAITPMAARMKRDGSISDRLLQYNDLYKDRRMQLQQTLLEVEDPKPNKVRKALSPRPRAIKKKPEPVQVPSFKPAVNKHSEEIAKNLAHSFTRLLLPKKPIKVEQPVFKPTINKKSKAITSSTPRWESLYQLKEQQTQKLDDLRAEIAAKQVDVECTFKPKTTKPAKPTPVVEFVKRQTAWQKSIAERVEAQQLIVADKDLEGCTFTPKINSLPSSYLLSKVSSERHLPKSTSETYREVHDEMSNRDFESALELLHAQLHEEWIN